VKRQEPVMAMVKLDVVRYDMLAYAEDMDMMAERKEDLNECACIFADAVGLLGTKNNGDKSKR
jgi:hypothetical protein